MRGATSTPQHTVLWGTARQTAALSARFAHHAREAGALVWVVGQSADFVAGLRDVVDASAWVHLAPGACPGLNLLDTGCNDLWEAADLVERHLQCTLDLPREVSLEAVAHDVRTIGADRLSFSALVPLAREMAACRGRTTGHGASDARTLGWYADAGSDSYRGFELAEDLEPFERAQAVRLALLRVLAGVRHAPRDVAKVICIEDGSWLTQPTGSPELDMWHSNLTELLLRRCRLYWAGALLPVRALPDGSPPTSARSLLDAAGFQVRCPQA